MVKVEVRPILPAQKWRRRHLRLPAAGATADGGQVSGKLLNVARSGLALETSSVIHIGHRYRLKVEFEDTVFWATTQVRWCMLRRTQRDKKGDIKPVYHAGLSVEESEPARQEELLEKLRRRLLSPPVS